MTILDIMEQSSQALRKAVRQNKSPLILSYTYRAGRGGGLIHDF